MSIIPKPQTPLRPSSTSADKPVRHFNQVDLSRRWSLSPRTLERWRWLKQGPHYLKVGGRVLYRLDDIESYETANRQHLPETNA